MMRFLIVLSIAALFSACTKEAELQTEVVRVNSIVCGTCGKTVETAVFGVEGVKSVNVDVDAKTLEVKYVSAQTNLQTIERAITDAGYDANDRPKDPGAYEKLDACCKID